MEIEKDQEAPGTEDRAEECAEAPEPEKGQQAGETGQEETADEAGEESEAAPEGVDPKTWAEKRPGSRPSWTRKPRAIRIRLNSWRTR